MNAQLPKRMTSPSVPTCLVHPTALSPSRHLQASLDSRKHEYMMLQ